jgi:hypothetical protein
MFIRVVLAMVVMLIAAPATRATAGLEVLTANQRVLTIAAIGGQIGIVQTRTLAMVHTSVMRTPGRFCRKAHRKRRSRLLSTTSSPV